MRQFTVLNAKRKRAILTLLRIKLLTGVGEFQRNVQSVKQTKVKL